jgi:hypothetical protein
VNVGFIAGQRDVLSLVHKALDPVDVGADPVRHFCFGWRGFVVLAVIERVAGACSGCRSRRVPHSYVFSRDLS